MNETYLQQVHNFLQHECWTKKHAKSDVKSRGEVFTPPRLVDEMLTKLPHEVFTNPTKTFLDNSCGNGAFLAAVLERKMQNGISHKDAIKTIYGVELDLNNCNLAKLRLSLKSADPEVMQVINHNVICADALDPRHPGWNTVGFYWGKDNVVNIDDLRSPA
jgi:type I restriction-modification system DNA methylase subunit